MSIAGHYLSFLPFQKARIINVFLYDNLQLRDCHIYYLYLCIVNACKLQEVKSFRVQFIKYL